MEHSKYFSEAELACRCGCGLMPKAETVELAELVSEAWGAALYCIAGARCLAHSKRLRLFGVASNESYQRGVSINLQPAQGQLAEFHEFCIKHLEMWNCYMENPAHTPLWVHLSTEDLS